MTDDERAKLVDVLERQLSWRGPNGGVMGHVVLERAHAKLLLEWVKQQPSGEKQ